MSFARIVRSSLSVPVVSAFTAAVSFSFAVSASAAPVKYTVDQAHSKVGFAVRHMMISDVSGNFKDFEGTFAFDADKAALSDAVFTAKTASINTENAKRDEHLRSADFFDAAKYPTISFEKTSLKQVSKDKYKWTGLLNMHGVSKPVTFDLEQRGLIKDPYGKMRAGFAATTTLKRSEWGLKWNKALEAGGGVVVSDDVRLMLDVEATQNDAASSAPVKK